MRSTHDVADQLHHQAQLPVLEALHRRTPNLKVCVSVEMEPQRDYRAEFGSLSVSVQKNFTIKRRWLHRSGFADQLNIHLPYDTLFRLCKTQPTCVVSYELGPRSLLSAIYRMVFRKSRLVLCVNVSEHTETSWGLGRRWIRPWLLRMADAVTYNGPSCKRYLESIGVPSSSLFHFPYAAHPATIYKGPVHRSDADRFRLLYVGQMTERKNPLEMFDVLSQWAMAHPDRTLDLTMIGRGNLRETLEKKDRPANFRVDFRGSVDPLEMPEVWKSHGIMIFPTLADEWGLVTNEAMHSGLPVIGSEYAQSSLTLIENGCNGYRFVPSDTESFSRAVDFMLSRSAVELEEMGRNARERVTPITPEYSANCLANAIHSVLSNK